MLLIVALRMGGMMVIVDAELMLKSLGMMGGGITWKKSG